MRHLAPLPTSDARLCSAAAAAGLRRALRIAAIRFSASCLFISLKVIFFTENYLNQSRVEIKFARALNGRFENRSERNGCGVAGFSKRPFSARPARFQMLAICLAGFRVPAGKPASQSADLNAA